METIAVYWESVIKTYGFQEACDLVLVNCDIREIGHLGEVLIDSQIESLKFALIQDIGSKMIFRCVVEQKAEAQVLEFFKDLEQTGIINGVNRQASVGLITFHGPHFGDRYGIAGAVYDALDGKINLIGAGFSGSVITLVMASREITDAKKLLSEAFEIPEYV
ncbi:hypothetical protein QUF76_06660 [Desulfobacterales bacterium HSG16]|nr:hypothetical protein [Desulfobacterales bacterium HSG16]